jgi:hypothetical protein
MPPTTTYEFGDVVLVPFPRLCRLSPPERAAVQSALRLMLG